MAAGVVLVLHGGREVSEAASRTTDPALLRMIPFAWAIRTAARRRDVVVRRVRYRYRGWNGSGAAPVSDARRALEETRRQHGDVPVVLLGHSMGGRVAVRVADDPCVRSVVLLAPWLPSGEPVGAVSGRRVTILHGDRDRTTSLSASVAWAGRAQGTADSVFLHRIRGGDHAMLAHSRAWHDLAAAAVVDSLAAAGVPRLSDLPPRLPVSLSRHAELLR